MAENDFKTKFNTGAEVLQKLLEGKASPVSDQYLRWKLWLNWKDIVGPTVSDHSEPISYRNGLLWLCVENSVWVQHFGFMTETIKQTINQKFKEGFVREIRYTTDRRQVPSIEDDQFRDNVKKFLK